MKKFIKLLVVILITAASLKAINVYASSDIYQTSVQEDSEMSTNDIYSSLRGWNQIENRWYYFDEYGIMQTGWFTYGNSRYYGYEEGEKKGAMATGLVEIGGELYYFRPSDCVQETGWKNIEGKWYYFNSTGEAQTGWFMYGNSQYYGYKEGKNKGAMASGLVELEGKMYYFRPSDCVQLSGILYIDGVMHCFKSAEEGKDRYEIGYEWEDPEAEYGWLIWENGDRAYKDKSGELAIGWRSLSGEWYYFNTTGEAKTGWFTYGNSRYYGYEEEENKGAMASGLVEIGENLYYFRPSDCVQETGWKNIEGKWYYFNATGEAQTGWFMYGNSQYYGYKEGKNKGAMASGLMELEGKMYYFRPSDCVQLSGMVYIDGVMHCFKSAEEGKDRYEIGYEWEDPEAEYGWLIWENGDKAYKDKSGGLAVGWRFLSGEWYYFNTTGEAKTGWFTYGNSRYYGYEEGEKKGAMATGLVEIGGELYYFRPSDCVQETGWKNIEGKWYYFNTTGEAQTGWFMYGNSQYYGYKEGENKGAMASGLMELEGKMYYFRPSDCVQQFGWILHENNKYYADLRTGELLYGKQIIDGHEYLFNYEGVCINGNAPIITKIDKGDDQKLRIEWKSIPGADEYVVEYSKNENFVDEVISDRTTSNYYVLENIEVLDVYYIRVKVIFRSKTQEGITIESDFSDIQRVTLRNEVMPEENSIAITECVITETEFRENECVKIKVHLEADAPGYIVSEDESYYIVRTDVYGNIASQYGILEELDKTFNIFSNIVIDSSSNIKEVIMDKIAVAVCLEDGTYQLVSKPMSISNPEAIATNTAETFKASSKKGIQGVSFASDSRNAAANIHNARYTNTKQTLLNFDIASIVGQGEAPGYVPYEYKGKTYYFSDCADMVANVRSLNAGYTQYLYGNDGNTKVSVSVCLLLSDNNAATNYLIDPAARRPGHAYYMLNVREEDARETLEALFLYLGELFGQSDCHVTNWILGNEINSSNAWNYNGGMDFNTYMECYATAFRLLYNGVKATKTGNNVCISLDNGWCAAPDTYPGKTTLDVFAEKIHAQNPDIDWSIAYHPYSYPLTRVDFWNDYSNTADSISTPYISMRNIEVLTNYVGALENAYGKDTGSIRVLLTEQGFSATGGSYVQGQALAWAYYKAEFNPRIDAFIIRALVDDWAEMQGGLYMGIMNIYQEKRTAYYVYEHMDSDLSKFNMKQAEDFVSQPNYGKFDEAKSIVCDTNWEFIVPNFDAVRLAQIK